jgi:hypothetical protein
MDNGSQTGEEFLGVINGCEKVAGVKVVADSSFASTASLLSSRPSFLAKGLDLLMKLLMSIVAIPFLCYISATKFKILKDIFDKAISELPIQHSTEYKDQWTNKTLAANLFWETLRKFSGISNQRGLLLPRNPTMSAQEHSKV